MDEVFKLKLLLAKYVNHVGYHEGIDFLSPGYEGPCLTNEERLRIKTIEMEMEPYLRSQKSDGKTS
jgi:hypothetical protein